MAFHGITAERSCELQLFIPGIFWHKIKVLSTDIDIKPWCSNQFNLHPDRQEGVSDLFINMCVVGDYLHMGNIHAFIHVQYSCLYTVEHQLYTACTCVLSGHGLHPALIRGRWTFPTESRRCGLNPWQPQLMMYLCSWIILFCSVVPRSRGIPGLNSGFLELLR